MDLIMNVQPIVSIIIPVYNGSNYLREAIDSALAQTYKFIDILVINDGSNDEGKTREIALSYGNKIQYYEKENGGVSSALNLGLQKMRGQYLVWLSHDDVYHPQNIEIQIKNRGNYKVSFTQTEMFMEKRPTITLYETLNLDNNNKIHGAFNYWKTWIYACALLIDKSCFDKVDIFNENLKTAQDTDITLRLLNKYDFVEIPLPLTFRRDHSESGFHVNHDHVVQENNYLMFKLLKDYGIDFFFPDCNNKIDLAKAYNKLGNYNFIASYEFSLFCYKKSVQIWPSYWNQAIYLLKLKRKIIICILHIQQMILSIQKI